MKNGEKLKNLRIPGKRFFRKFRAYGVGILYAVFVVEIIVGYLEEGAPQAALVMGLATGLFAVVWGVLLGRFVFLKASKSSLLEK
jgi:hypothetical protein